jgi:hypothetical protein
MGMARIYIEDFSYNTCYIAACVRCARCLKMRLLYCWLSIFLRASLPSRFLTMVLFSMAFPAHSGPKTLVQFRNHYSHKVGLLGRVISPSQSRYLNIRQHKQNKHTPNIHTPSGIRTHYPSIRVSKDNSCLRPHGYCDRLIMDIHVIVLHILV